MTELMVALIAWLAPALGLPQPADTPRVVFAAHCDIQALAYDGTRECRDDGAHAFYLREADTIYLPDTWRPGDLGDVAMLLHELAQFVQDRAGVLDDVRCHGVQVEKPAWDAQLAWLKAAGVADPMKASGINGIWYLFATSCPSQFYAPGDRR